MPRTTTTKPRPPKALSLKRERKIGRPSIRTPELEDHILRELRSGRTLYAVTRDTGMPALCTVREWAERDENFASRLSQARDEGWEAIVEQALDIADDESLSPHSRRVRVETRHKTAALMRPDRFGQQQRIDLTTQGQALTPLNPLVALARLAALLEQAATTTDGGELTPLPPPDTSTGGP